MTEPATQPVADPNPNHESAEDLATLDAEMKAYLEGDESAPKEVNTQETEQEPNQEQDAKAEEPETEEQAETEEKPKADLSKALASKNFENRQLKNRLKAMEAQLAEIKIPKPQNDDGEEMPDAETDPIGALRYATMKLKRYEQQEQAQIQQQQQQAQQQEAQRVLTDFMSGAEEEAVAHHPDYQDAVKYQMDSRRREIAAMGYGAQADQIMAQEYVKAIIDAYQSGQNPAMMIYNQATARGYKPAEPQPEPAPTSEVQETQQQAQVDPGPTPAQQKLDKISEASQLPKTTRGGGGKTSDTVTEEMLMSASGSKFDELWSRYEAQRAN